LKRIIIIGAGPAGLTAAYELLKNKNEFKVTILEESDTDVGGISRTVNHKGNRMDIGGHRFFSKDRRVTEFWNTFLPTQGQAPYDYRKLKRAVRVVPDGPDPETEDKVMLLRNRVSRIYYQKKFFDYPISMKWQTFANMGLPTTIVAGFSYLRAAMVKHKETSLETFYINRFGKKLYSMFFEGYTEKLWGRHPRDISPDWGAQRVKGLSVIAVVKDMFSKLFGKKQKQVETSLIEEFSYPKFGPGQLWEAVAKEVRRLGGEILMGHTAVSIGQTENSISFVRCDTANGPVTLICDELISSMPIRDLCLGLESFPSALLPIAKDLPYRDFVTVGILSKRIHLKNKTKIPTLADLPPDNWIYVQDVNVKLGRIQIFNNWSPYMVKNPDTEVWIGLEYFCQEGDSFWNMEEKDCVQFAVKELIEMGILNSEDAVLDSHRERVKKAYPAYFDSYKDIDQLIDYLNTIPNLYCVGRNGQHRYNNMDHSMATAMEAVTLLRSGSADKSPIWDVNTENTYHEEKK
jgi:protoporphyrinogen oxidase